MIGHRVSILAEHRRNRRQDEQSVRQVKVYSAAKDNGAAEVRN